MKNLKQLIANLNIEIQEKGINNALDLLTPFTQYIGEDWKMYVDFQKDEFQYSVVYEDEHFKLLLIYWNGNNKSNKHGHMNGGGLMRVLSGQIVETRFHPDNDEKAVGVFNYGEGELSYIHDALAYHVVENREDNPAVSLHLYCSGHGSTFGIAS